MRPFSSSLALIASLAVVAPTYAFAETEEVQLTFSGRLKIDGDPSRYGTLNVDCVVRVPRPGGGTRTSGISSAALFRDGVAQVPVDADGYVNYEIEGTVMWDTRLLTNRNDIAWTCTAQNNGPGTANAVVHPISNNIQLPSTAGTVGGHVGVIRSGTGQAVVTKSIPPGN